MTIKGKFIYILVRPNGIPFYVGKGNRERAFAHARKNIRVRNVISKIKEAKENLKIRFVFYSLDENTVFAEEKRLISLFGIKEDGGCLYNFLYGGEGATQPEIIREKMRISSKARWAKEEEREKLRKAQTALWQNVDYREKLVQAHVGKTHSLSEESKLKIGESNKRTYSDPIKREEVSIRMKQFYKDNPEALATFKEVGRGSCMKIATKRQLSKQGEL